MDALPARASITLVVMVLLLSLYLSEVQGQSLPSCPIGYQRNLNGKCVPLETLQTCPMGYQRSVSGLCVPARSSQTCPVGYKQIPPGICVPFTTPCTPYGHPTTASINTNQSLTMASNLTGGLPQNSTNSTSPVKESSNATNQTQIQIAPVTGSQQQGQSQQQPPPQLYPYVPPSMLQPQQQQPFVQGPSAIFATSL